MNDVLLLRIRKRIPSRKRRRRRLPDPRLGNRDMAATIAAFDRQNAMPGVIKTAEDLVRYALVMERVRPDLVIETGTAGGGSARFYEALGADVITIDVGNEQSRIEGGVEFVKGSSTDPVVVAHATERARAAATVLVTLDSDHSAEHVRGEIAAYAGLVTPGSYLVVEDGHISYIRNLVGFNGSPLDAIEEFLESDDGARFEIDEELEALFAVSMFPKGWLRRRRDGA